MHAVHGLVDGVLLQACLALQSVQWLLLVVIDRSVVEVLQVFACQLLQVLHLFLIRHAYVWSQVEVEGWDSLSAVHFVLACFQRDAGQYGCCLYALGRTAGTVACRESVVQDDVQRMLHAGEALGWIVVLVVDVEIVVCNGVARLF